jgi:CRP-like cAMP-binding protein/Ca2+-binding EF-hand superfamily protein
MGACNSKQSSANSLSPYLSSTPFPYRLSPHQLEIFSRFFTLKRFSRGSVIIDESDAIPSLFTGSDYYVIIEGEVDFHTETAYLCSKLEGDSFLDPIYDPAVEQRRIDKDKVKTRLAAMQPLSPAPGTIGRIRGRRNSLDPKSVPTASLFSSTDNQIEEAAPISTPGAEEGNSCGNSIKMPSRQIMRTVRVAKSSENLLGSNEKKRMATATAKSNCTLLVLTSLQLAAFLKQNPTCRDAVLPLLLAQSEALSELAFFRGINTKKLILLGIMLRFVALADSDVLFEEGSLGSSLYIVLEGTVKATVQIPDPNHGNNAAGSAGNGLMSPRNSLAMPNLAAHGHSSEDNSPRTAFNSLASGSNNSANNSQAPMITKELKQFTKNDIFGEISLIMDIPRTASITATHPCLLLELQRDSFQKFLKLVPNTVNLHNIMKQRTAEHFRKYKVPFFEAIPDDKYQSLAALCKIEQIPANKILFSEGDIGNSFYIIAYGEVKVTVKQKNSAGEVIGDRELVRMGPGKYFGEIALVQDTPRTATVITTKRCVILSITKENFQLFFNEAPEAIAEFEVKLARYDCQLRSVLYHQIGLDYFVQHLKREFALENIEFWKACRDFRLLAQLDKQEREKLGFLNAAEALGTPEKGQNEEKHSEIPASGESESNHPHHTESEEIQCLLSSLKDRSAHNSNYSAEQQENLRAMYYIYSAAQNSLENYAITALEFKDMLYVLDLHVHENDSDALCKDLAFQQGADITLSQFLSNCGRFTDVTFIGQELVKNSKKHKKNNENHMISTIKLMLKFEKTIHENKLAHLRRIFDKCDKDHSGFIEFNEFHAIMAELADNNKALILSDDALQAAFNAIDENCSGTITFCEFVHYNVIERQAAINLHSKMAESAHTIQRKFIGDNAETQVNIKGPTALKISDDMAKGNIHIHMFDKAEDEILKLMSADSFARFKQSDLFEQFLESSDSYKHLDPAGKEKKLYERAKSNFARILEATEANSPTNQSNNNSTNNNTNHNNKNNSATPVDTADIRFKMVEETKEDDEEALSLSATPNLQSRHTLAVQLAGTIQPATGHAVEVTQTPEQIKAHQEAYKEQQRKMFRGE